MRSVLSHLVLLAWALWLGGTISVFVFGFHFFASLPKEVARDSARSMFQAFGPYEIALAGVAVLCSAVMLAMHPTKLNLLQAGCMVIGGAMVVAGTLGIQHRLEVMHDQGLVGTPEWLKWHIKSMKLMGMQAIVLLLSGLVIFRTIQKSDVSIQVKSEHPAPEPV